MSTTAEAPPIVDPGSPGGPESASPQGRRVMRRWWVWAPAAAAVFLLAAGAVAMTRSGEDTDPAVATSANVAEAVRTDLVEVQSYDATLGTVAGDPVTSQRTGTVTSAVAEGATAESGEVLFAVDGDPVVLMYGTSPAWRDIAATEDTDTVVNRANGTVTEVVESGTVLEEGDIAYWVNGEPVTILYGDVPAYRAMYDASTNLEGEDVLQLETFLDGAGYDDIGISVDGEFTSATESVVENWQEDIGATVDGRVELGEVIFISGPAEVVAVDVEVGDTVADGTPVLSLAGDTPMQGEDVRQLEQNLAALGYDAGGSLAVDDVFDEATSEAIEAWQADLGLEVDGTVALGDIFFAPTAIRVSEQLASPGTNVTPGVAVLAVSSADKVVTLDLPAEDQDLVEVGVGVVVELPDGTDVAATVTEVATVASVDQQGNAVFEVTIELDDPSAAAGLDEAPVDVELVTDSVEGVVAVPVTALLALSEGGYAVEVRSADGTTRLVAVDPGFFADGLVEVRSDTLEPGDEVVVP